MVNVTKANFLKESNDLLKHLPTASFVAIDEEMTGIMLPGSKRPSKDHTPGERYASSLKEVAERYSIIQVGVALFHPHPGHSSEDPESPHFLVRKYNFYLFPSANNEVTRDVVMNPSSLEFLRQHNMNFDVWTGQGVPFMTVDAARSRIDRYRKSQKAAQKAYVNQSNNAGNRSHHHHHHDPSRRCIEFTRTMDISFHARAMANLREWIDSARQTNPSSSSSAAAAVAAAPPPPQGGNGNGNGDDDDDDNTTTNHHHEGNPDGAGDEEGSSHLLPSCNSFMRRALYESIGKEYPSLHLERDANDPTRIRAFRMNPQEFRSRYERMAKEAFQQMVLDIGFWRVFYALSQACRGYRVENHVGLASHSSQAENCWDAEERLVPLPNGPIPIVVHNGLMDLLFLMTHCRAHELPSTWMETKSMIHSYFPFVYDTKVLSTECHGAARHDDTVLSKLYNKLILNEEQQSSSTLVLFDILWTEGEDEKAAGNAATDAADSAAPQPQLHEAAHDAFMTGTIFAQLCHNIFHHLEEEKTAAADSDGGGGGGGGGANDVNSITASNSVALKKDASFRLPFPHLTAPDPSGKMKELFGRNKLYLMLTMYTIDLANPTSDPLSRGMSFDSTFRVSGSDPSVATRDIIRCLTSSNNGSNNNNGRNEGSWTTDPAVPAPQQQQGGDQRYHFEIVWVDDTTFLVANQNSDPDVQREQAAQMKRTLQARFARATVVSLQEYFAEQQKQQQQQQQQQEERKVELAVAEGSSTKRTRWTWTEALTGWLFGGGGGSSSEYDESAEGDDRSVKRTRTS